MTERDWLHVARSVEPMPVHVLKLVKDAARRNGKEAELVLNKATGRWDLVVREVKK